MSWRVPELQKPEPTPLIVLMALGKSTVALAWYWGINGTVGSEQRERKQAAQWVHRPELRYCGVL